jgi:hypothetical protein
LGNPSKTDYSHTPIFFFSLEEHLTFQTDRSARLVSASFAFRNKLNQYHSNLPKIGWIPLCKVVGLSVFLLAPAQSNTVN